MRVSNRLNILGWLLLVTLPCASQEVAAPLGLEMGKSTCAEATRKLKVVSNDVSVWSDGPILRIPANSSSIELESLVEALVICNAQDSVVFVGLTFPKGGNAAEVRTSTAKQLDAKYWNVQRNLPLVGDGYAEWKAPNATVEMVSTHLSFQFDVRYWAPGAKALYTKWQEVERRRRDQKKAGSL